VDRRFHQAPHFEDLVLQVVQFEHKGADHDLHVIPK
jgi:hypothetical protein